MREIRFRGKDIETGKWVYGYLLEKWHGHNKPPIYVIDTCISFESNGWDSIDVYQVIPETVGQYTWLKDKNFKEIYEGDILETKWKDGKKTRRVVSYCNGAFVMFNKIGNYDLPLMVINLKLYETIGNIHDNLELLEEALK